MPSLASGDPPLSPVVGTSEPGMPRPPHSETRCDDCEDDRRKLIYAAVYFQVPSEPSGRMTVTRYSVPAMIEACDKLMSPPAVDVCPVSSATRAPVLMLLTMTVMPVSLTRRFPVVRSRRSVMLIVPDDVSPVNDPNGAGSAGVTSNENDGAPALADPEKTGVPDVTAKLVTGVTLAEPAKAGSDSVTDVSNDAPEDPPPTGSKRLAPRIVAPRIFTYTPLNAIKGAFALVCALCPVMVGLLAKDVPCVRVVYRNGCEAVKSGVVDPVARIQSINLPLVTVVAETFSPMNKSPIGIAALTCPAKTPNVELARVRVFIPLTVVTLTHPAKSKPGFPVAQSNS